MTPQVFPGFERLSAAGTGERSLSRMDALVEPNGRRVLELLAAVSTRTVVVVAVPIQYVLLEVNLEFEADMTLVARVRTRFTAK